MEKEISRDLYKNLEKVGASEEMRQFYRRNITTEMIESFTDDRFHYFIFGSYTEGTTVPDLESDIDTLEYPVHTHAYADARTAPDGGAYLLVPEVGRLTGYVKLQLVINRHPVTIDDMLPPNEKHKTDYQGRICFAPYFNLELNGPADTVETLGQTYDKVFAIRCSSVPDFAKQWIERCKQKGWPPQMISTMSKMNCFVVCVGHESSPERHLQWRLSFSLQERELMFNLNPVQHKCYILMKMIKKDVIEQLIGEKSALSSYHLKTTLLHVIENNPRDIWTQENLLQCLKECLIFLYVLVEDSCCPHFFLREANLFDRESFRRQRRFVLRALHEVLKLGYAVIFTIKCNNLNYSFCESQISDEIDEKLNKEKYLINRDVARNIGSFIREKMKLICAAQIDTQNCIGDLILTLNDLKEAKTFSWYSEQQTREVLQLIIPMLHHRIAILLATDALQARDKPEKQNRLLRLSKCYFLRIKDVDVLAATLSRATVMYKIGEYDASKELIESKSFLEEYIMTCCSCSNNPPKSKFVKDCESFGVPEIKKIVKENISHLCLMTTYVLPCIRFFPQESALIHPVLKLEMARSKGTLLGSRNKYTDFWYDWAVVDGKVYYCFLQYLVYSRLNQPLQKQQAIENFKTAITSISDLRHVETAYNMLGWIVKMENRVGEALQCWQKSLELMPSHNAAKWHLVLYVIDRVHSTRS